MLPSGGTCVIQSLRQSDAGVFIVCIKPTQNNIGITWKLSGRSVAALGCGGCYFQQQAYIRRNRERQCLRPLTVQIFRSIAECCLNNTYLFFQQHENSFISQLKVGCKVADSRIYVCSYFALQIAKQVPIMYFACKCSLQSYIIPFVFPTLVSIYYLHILVQLNS